MSPRPPFFSIAPHEKSWKAFSDLTKRSSCTLWRAGIFYLPILWSRFRKSPLFFRVLSGILLFFGGLVLLAFFFFSQSSSSLLPTTTSMQTPLASEEKTGPDKNGISVEGSVFSGVDAQGRPFVLKAERAIQHTRSPEKGALSLENLSGTLENQDATPYVFTAKTASYVPSSEKVALSGGVTFVQDGQWRGSFPRARLDLKTRELFGEGPVEAHFAYGSVRSRTISMQGDGAHVSFSGEVSGVFDAQ